MFKKYISPKITCTLSLIVCLASTTAIAGSNPALTLNSQTKASAIKSLALLILPLSAFSYNYSAVNSKIQSSIDNYRAKYNIPNIEVAISTHGDVTRNFLSGVKNLKTKEPLITSDLSEIGSVTKSYTSALILQLVAAGKINLDAKIDTYLSSSQIPKRWDDITVKQLLNMTSGIYNYHDDPIFKDYAHKTYFNKPRYQLWKSSQLVAIAAKHPDYFLPGKSWNYSNTNYILASMIVTSVTGKSYSQVLHERLLGSGNINLLNTEYSETYFSKPIIKRMIHGYGQVKNKIKNTTTNTISLSGAGGGIISSAPDVTHWVRALFSGKVINKKELASMQSLVCGTDEQAKSHCKLGAPTTLKTGGFGLGLMEKYDPKYGVEWNFPGRELGYLAYFVWLPKQDIQITILMGTDDEKADYMGELTNKILKILTYDNPKK